MTICLNMIVKDEAAVILRCLESVRPYIDHWVIVDTGSTDITTTLIAEYLKDVPGELHQRPWVDFAHNRNEALALAKDKADYLLFIDADDCLVASEEFALPELIADAYHLWMDSGDMQYRRAAFISAKIDWHWEGVCHEVLMSNSPASFEDLNGLRVKRGWNGARAKDEGRFLRDADILKRGLEKEPGNARYQFYLAQSLRDAGLKEAALEAYKKRTTMHGWEEERWFAVYQMAVLSDELAHSPADVRNNYLVAYQMRPSRAEPLYCLARYHRLRSEFSLAYLFAKQACAVPFPTDKLFVDRSIYYWRSLDELSVAAYYCSGKAVGGIRAIGKMLAVSPHIPDVDLARINHNLTLYTSNRSHAHA